MNRIAIDLELHSDGKKTGKIIQLGYSIFSTSGEILFTGGDFIITGEPLSDYIINLTGIQERHIAEQGVTLDQAYNNMVAKCEEYKTFMQIVEWGSGDVSQLKEELNGIPWLPWKFGRASLNIKAVYQMFRMARGKTHSGGLKRSLKNIGKEFQSFKDPTTGRMRGNHDARADALNTAIMYLHLQNDISRDRNEV